MTETITVSWTLYQEMWDRITAFKNNPANNRYPNYANIVYNGKTYQVSQAAYLDAQRRVAVFIKTNLTHRYPNTVTLEAEPVVATYNSDKDLFLKSMALAIGGGFNTLTGCYNLIRKNEAYRFALGDAFGQAKAVENLLRDVGNNCVDYAQLLTAVAQALNKVASKGYITRYVRTYCVKSEVGHVYIEVKGGEFGGSWVAVDGAAGASAGSKYPIGEAWCQSYPNKIYNQSYLLLDDGI